MAKENSEFEISKLKKKKSFYAYLTTFCRGTSFFKVLKILQHVPLTPANDPRYKCL